MFPDSTVGSVRNIEVSDLQPDGVHLITIYSPALHGRGDFSVFAPSGIEKLVSVPLVVLLHGVYASHWAWFFNGAAHRTADNLIRGRRIRPMLLVAPSDGLYGDGSGYLRHSGCDYESWIVKDVLESVSKTFPCADRKSPTFIAGLSMGGYGALRLGAKHSGVFRAISAHSAITRIEEISSFVSDPFPFGQIPPDEKDLIYWFEKNRCALPALRFDCGINDPLLGGNRRLHLELTRREIPHSYFEFEGGHDWSYWRAHLSSTLIFFEELLRASDTTPPESPELSI